MFAEGSLVHNSIFTCKDNFNRDSVSKKSYTLSNAGLYVNLVVWDKHIIVLTHIPLKFGE